MTTTKSDSRKQVLEGRRLHARGQAHRGAAGCPSTRIAEPVRAHLREALADVADADDAERLAGDFLRVARERARKVPRVAAQLAVDAAEVAREHQDRHEAVLGHRLRVAAGNVGHHHATFACRRRGSRGRFRCRGSSPRGCAARRRKGRPAGGCE